MKALSRSLLVTLVFSLAGLAMPQTIQALDSDLPSDKTDPSKMSSQEAANYVVDLVNQMIKARNKTIADAPASPVPLRIHDVEQQAARVGFDNLLVFYKIEHPRGNSAHEGNFTMEGLVEKQTMNDRTFFVTVPGDFLLDEVVRHALRMAATDNDIPTVLDAAGNDPELVDIIVRHPEWWKNPQVVAFVKSEITLLSDPSKTGTAFSKGEAAYALMRLNRMEAGSSDPNLNDQFLATVQNAAQHPASYEGWVIEDILRKCLQSSSDAYDDYIPDLFTAMDSKMANVDIPGSQGLYPASVVDFLLMNLPRNLKLCGNSQVQTASLHMIKPLLFDSSSGIQPACVAALVGNRDYFERVVQHYGRDSSNPDRPEIKNALGYESQFFDTIIYNGPGDKLQGILDNLESAVFDPDKGQWVVTVSGYEAKPAPTADATAPFPSPAKPSAPLNPTIISRPAAPAPIAVPPPPLQTGTIISDTKIESHLSSGGYAAMPLQAGEKVSVISRNKDGTLTVLTSIHFTGNIPENVFRPDETNPASQR